MSTKLYVALFICLLGFQISCKTEQTSATSLEPQPTVQKDISDEEIRELFLEVKRDLNEPNMPKLRTLPKEKVIRVIREIKKNGNGTEKKDIQDKIKDEYLKLRSAFFLWELGDEPAENERYILEKAQTKKPKELYSIRFEAIAFIGDFIAKGKKEYLPIVFAATPDSNGAYSTYGILADEITNSPKTFLQYLSKENSKIRESVYEILYFSENVYGKEEWKKLEATLKKYTNDEDVGKTAKELLKPIVTENSSKKEIRNIILNRHFYEGD